MAIYRLSGPSALKIRYARERDSWHLSGMTRLEVTPSHARMQQFRELNPFMRHHIESG